LNVSKILLLAKQTSPRRKNVWCRHRSDTKTTLRSLKCRQEPLLAVCARSLPYCVRKLQMFME